MYIYFLCLFISLFFYYRCIFFFFCQIFFPCIYNPMDKYLYIYF
ncbi:hypothetical protein, partial [Plasmodium yoelii yoelii]